MSEQQGTLVIDLRCFPCINGKCMKQAVNLFRSAANLIWFNS